MSQKYCKSCEAYTEHSRGNCEKCGRSNRAHIGLALSVTLLLAGCATNPNARWLAASQQMLAIGDPAISTTDPAKVSLLTQWAVTNGYHVEVSQADPVAGERRGMFFMVLKKP